MVVVPIGSHIIADHAIRVVPVEGDVGGTCWVSTFSKVVSDVHEHLQCCLVADVLGEDPVVLWLLGCLEGTAPYGVCAQAASVAIPLGEGRGRKREREGEREGEGEGGRGRAREGEGGGERGGEGGRGREGERGGEGEARVNVHHSHT